MCAATVTGTHGDVFGCVLAPHDDSTQHWWPTEYQVYGRRLALHHDTAWLVSEITSLHVQIEHLKRDQAADDTAARLRRLLGRLVAIAPANSKRKTVPLAEVQDAWMEARG